MKRHEILWKSYADTAIDRGRFVVDCFSEKMALAGKKILDVGCGVGGTSLALSEAGADVTAIDTQAEKLELLKCRDIRIHTRLAYGERLPLDGDSFDGVVLQDVIEHTQDPELVVREVYRVLKPGGWMYFQTPNKWSVINFFSDPHWGVPLVSVTKRSFTFRIISKFYKLEDQWREDLAQLLSPREIKMMLSLSRFRYQFLHKKVVGEMFDHPSRVVSSRIHLAILKFTKILKHPIRGLVSNGDGLVNSFLTPTWYLLCQKI